MNQTWLFLPNSRPPGFSGYPGTLRLLVSCFTVQEWLTPVSSGPKTRCQTLTLSRSWVDGPRDSDSDGIEGRAPNPLLSPVSGHPGPGRRLEATRDIRRAATSESCGNGNQVHLPFLVTAPSACSSARRDISKDMLVSDKREHESLLARGTNLVSEVLGARDCQVTLCKDQHTQSVSSTLAL